MRSGHSDARDRGGHVAAGRCRCRCRPHPCALLASWLPLLASLLLTPISSSTADKADKLKNSKIGDENTPSKMRTPSRAIDCSPAGIEEIRERQSRCGARPASRQPSRGCASDLGECRPPTKQRNKTPERSRAKKEAQPVMSAAQQYGRQKSRGAQSRGMGKQPSRQGAQGAEPRQQHSRGFGGFNRGYGSGGRGAGMGQYGGGGSQQYGMGMRRGSTQGEVSTHTHLTDRSSPVPVL